MLHLSDLYNGVVPNSLLPPSLECPGSVLCPFFFYKCPYSKLLSIGGTCMGALLSETVCLHRHTHLGSAMTPTLSSQDLTDIAAELVASVRRGSEERNDYGHF